MDYKQGKSRNDVYFTCLEQQVELDSWARVVDIFVDAMDMESLGFKNSSLNKQGNEPYHPGDLFKLLIYGQRYGIRSANKLAHQCKVNVEVIWLLRDLRPSPRTICYFRTHNEKAIKNAHKALVKKLKGWNLISGQVLALDSTKVRGQNSLKNNFNQKKINRHLDYIDNKIDEFLQQIKKVKTPKSKSEINDKINTLRERKEKYLDIEKQVQASPDGQVSTTDPDSRAVIKHRNIVEVGYNVQTTVDWENQMIVDVFAGSVTDRSDLAAAAKRSQDLLNEHKIDLLADAGYHNGADIAYCERRGVRTFIPPGKIHHQKNPGFRKSDFIYDSEKDVYICPDNQELERTLTFKKKNNRRAYRVKRYSTDMCQGCPLRSQCTTSPKGRTIERPAHQEHTDRNNSRVKRYHDFYRLRQQIVEPVFGIWKRQWHFDHLLLKTKKNVETEVTIAAITYNLMRLLSVKGSKWIKERLKTTILFIFRPLMLYNASQYSKISIFRWPLSGITAHHRPRFSLR